ncbi:DNA-binding transcriptional repressor DeoR [Phocoenobacter skyensis]|uniref:DNA-binding transcriptional repressor DeoR n=1 Tax=Phocoenobacter skyensis TaxID=97481 RepID=A0A1H7ULH1_9PAST|nr:DNA-binding transcriptional repressor DeoR [Pasteurella skyensis]MDP8079448.1 DNA-binding transcriptional repressor DeoR [Pasteurella skyensis]MDP8085335.1 DNA-binding transcriptional repressor DeoR [Pasteurella skyensis]MDP8163443.1 DNA-binding transcriptional repressor DeoR [Pasteurella skyensis]MDP8170326.1 DNA-binding transcriptional repressor DeoR [Pasteurella skyensis]MDP8173734.1 DNA-binding transcriptional repressor DeoR [Pasteurella skyensis]
MSKVNSRIQQLSFLLKKMDKIHLRDAAEILNVSEMTIRRDLSSNSDSITLLGGYIVNSPQANSQNNYVILEQETKNIAEKMYVGKLAASQLVENDVVFFDCGSTIPFIASQIPRSLKFTAVCCSINTFLILQEYPYCDLILCGGQYSRHNSALNAISLSNEIDNICTTKAFISTAGVSHTKGVTCFYFDEVQTKLKAMAKTEQSILVFDHSKVNKSQQAYICSINEFDTIITNQPLSDEFDTKELNIMI